MFTVTKVWDCGETLMLGDGIRPSEIQRRPELNNLVQGIQLELRLPNKTAHKTFLLNYGVSAIRKDGDMLVMEEDAPIRFRIVSESGKLEIPVGTEVWWLIEEANISIEEISRLMVEYS